MIRRIMCREILENLLTLRFALSLLLIVGLFAACGFVFVAKYKQDAQDYWKDHNENLSNLREQTGRLCDVARYHQTVYMKPKVLGFCAEGFDKYLPNRFRLNAFARHLPEVKAQTDSAPGRFTDVDWAFIVSVIISFVALTFTYDRVCGEREAGTLRMTLAAPVRRHEVLIGKYAAALLTLGIPLALGVLVNLVIIGLSPDVAIGVGNVSKIVAVVGLSLLYLSIFVLLGMLVSSCAARAANSMVVLLLV